MWVKYVNILKLIKKEIIVGPGLIAFAWNRHNQEAEASRVQGHSELHFETQSQKERMAGEGPGGRRENGMVEEKNYFQSVLNKKRLYFLEKHGSNKITFGPFLFSHPECTGDHQCSSFSLHDPLSSPHPSHNPQHRHHFQKLFSKLESSFQCDSLTSSHVSSPQSIREGESHVPQLHQSPFSREWQESHTEDTWRDSV